MQRQTRQLETDCVGANKIDVSSPHDVAENEHMELEDDDELSSERPVPHVGHPTKDQLAVKRQARARLACDLLLARLYRYHPDYALAHLKGIVPRVIKPDASMKLESGPAPENGETTADDLHGTPDISLIVQKVANFYGIPVADICSGKRALAIAASRQVAMYLARTMTQCPLRVIGARIGGRDHTTVHHSIQSVRQKVAKNTRARIEIETIKKQIRVALPPQAPAPEIMSESTRP